MKKGFAGAVLALGMLAGCSGAEDTGTGNRQDRIAAASSDFGFSVTGSTAFQADRVRVSAGGYAAGGEEAHDAPDWLVIRLAEGASGRPKGAVGLYLPADIGTGTHSLVDMGDFMWDVTGSPGAAFEYHSEDYEGVLSLSEPGVFVIDRAEGGRLTGRYNFEAADLLRPEIRVSVTGTFRDLELKSTAAR
ncbi:MAG: hypothetical protein ACK4GT_14210 [Pararhodobacter sp.]